METDLIEIVCACGRVNKYRWASIGKQGRCPGCGRVERIAASSDRDVANQAAEFTANLRAKKDAMRGGAAATPGDASQPESHPNVKPVAEPLASSAESNVTDLFEIASSESGGGGGSGGGATTTEQPSSPEPRQSWFEILLEPRTIHWLLVIGGALMTLGLVIWLASLGLFENKLVLAFVLGGANCALLGAGMWMVMKSRYRLAGRAIALLGSVLMPLNLWFYHVQELITLKGHLWVAGVVVCVIYALVAVVLRDALFVYAVQAGVTLTGLLLLADFDAVRSLPTLSLFLAALGLISIHLERAFPDDEGPFARKRFGQASFWCGHLQLWGGLIVLALSQILNVLKWPEGGLVQYGWQSFETDGFPLVPVCIWLAGAYAYAYSDLVVRRQVIYTFMSGLCLLLAELTAVYWRFRDAEALIALLALTAMAINCGRYLFKSESQGPRRAMAALAMVLMALPLLIGVQLHIRATASFMELAPRFRHETTWWFVTSFVVLAISARASAHMLRKEYQAWSAVYFFVSAAAVLIAAAGMLRLLGVTQWHMQSVCLMLIPIAYLVASRLYKGHSQERPLAWIAQTAVPVLVAQVFVSSLRTEDLFQREDARNLWFFAFFALASGFYIFSAATRKRPQSILAAATMACAAVWQAMCFWNPYEAWYAVVFGVIGLILLIGSRVLVRRENIAGSPLFLSANVVLSIAFVSAALQGGARTLVDKIHRIDLLAVVCVLATSLLAMWMVGATRWRRWYAVTSITLGALCFLMLNILSVLTGWQKVEIFCVVLGLASQTLASYVLLTRSQGDILDMSRPWIWIGSVLATLPILIAVCHYRFVGSEARLSMPNEIGLLTISLIMLMGGYILQLKGPTLIGGASLVAHLAIIIIFAGMRAQVAIGVYLAAGGALFFGAGVALAAYRERLKELPDLIAKREGVFKILNWR